MAHGNEINGKRYFWLKLDRHFFNNARIKKLRRLAGGDTYTIIYLKLLLLSIEFNGLLIYEGIEETFEKEMALTRLNYINSQVEAEKKAEEESQIEKDNRITSGQETFTYNGGTYQITSQLKSDANEIKRNNDFKDQLKAKCGTTDPYDASKIPNGTTFEIKADNRGSNDFNFWDDIGAFLFSPLGAGAWDSWGNWNTLYVTFYNGQWYKSDKKV